jgi:steroid delta-isomerase
MPDEDTRRAMPREYSQRLNSGDVDGVVDLFTEDVIFEDPVGRPPLVGREALRTHLHWAVQGQCREEPGRPVTSMDERFVVTPATVTLYAPEEMIFHMVAVTELDEEGRGTHVRAFWGLTDMSMKPPPPGRRLGLDGDGDHA